ncbi:unnamed protein product [Cylicocyclus nassatus]|uniref:Uncharacterized protein n=1 Tax=Cylicocyclus nassatus TaxID=53992 RepID=A0AA36MC23_CYLNA|nr:unnamed protein product [Cylicocyclus nassatus]
MDVGRDRRGYADMAHLLQGYFDKYGDKKGPKTLLLGCSHFGPKVTCATIFSPNKGGKKGKKHKKDKKEKKDCPSKKEPCQTKRQHQEKGSEHEHSAPAPGKELAPPAKHPGESESADSLKGQDLPKPPSGSEMTNENPSVGPPIREEGGEQSLPSGSKNAHSQSAGPQEGESLGNTSSVGKEGPSQQYPPSDRSDLGRSGLPEREVEERDPPPHSAPAAEKELAPPPPPQDKESHGTMKSGIVPA